MTGGWNVGNGPLVNPQDIGYQAAGSTGSNLTSSATINVKGAWVQLTSSTAADASWALIQPSSFYDNGSSSLVDIGVGAAGSEIVIIPNLPVGGQIEQAWCLLIPLCIPAGTAISARCQSNFASNVLKFKMTLFSDSFGASGPGPSVYDAYGPSTSTSYGTTVDSGATLNTKGAWAQLAASLTYDCPGFFLAFDPRATGNTNVRAGSTPGTYDYFSLDVGVGAAGSEVVLIPNIMVGSDSVNSFNQVVPQHTPFFPIQIPAGQRIAVRTASATVTTTPGRTFGASFFAGRL